MIWNQNNGGGQNASRDLKGGFATTAAFMLAMIFGPIVNEYTIEYVLYFARRSYSHEFVKIFEFAWMVACFPFVFFAARAGIVYALTAAGIYFAYRLAA